MDDLYPFISKHLKTLDFTRMFYVLPFQGFLFFGLGQDKPLFGMQIWLSASWANAGPFGH